MKKIDYVASLIEVADKIYIDTSALMNVEEFRKMVESIKGCLLDNKKRIIINRAVCLELAKHLGGENRKKSELVMEVFEIICNNQELFMIDNLNLNEFDISKAFADAKLLADLTENRTNCKQLLITNDKNLSRDVYGLNNLESCRGQKIEVCYINRDGKLLVSEYTEHGEERIEPQVKEIIKVVKVKERQQEESKLNIAVITISSITVGFMFGKYGNEIVKYFKQIKC